MGDIVGILAKTALADALRGMTPRTGQRPPPSESASSVVTGVLVGSGAFYSVTNSVVATMIVTAFAVVLAIALPGRRHGDGQ
jgi:hypothetical protein